MPETKTIKALSIKQPWASLIVDGKKTIEVRTWSTKYRGELLIVSSANPKNQGPAGMALAIADLVDCRPMRPEDSKAACSELDDHPEDKKTFAWVLDNIRPLKNAFPVKGKLNIYNVEIKSA